ncbi:MAG: hypothetical protein AB1790_10550 [Pseudomonadota bacterium]
MSQLPDKTQQIVQAHAALIHRVVLACHNRAQVPDLDQVLKIAADNGWTELVAAIRLILAGRRDPGVLTGLDEEDGVVAQAILRGLQDPSTLPDPNVKPDPTLAAPGLAAMIHQSGRGNTQVLQILAGMAEQMSRAGGDMARLAAAIRPLVNGERDPEKLCKGMGVQGEGLVLSILAELGKLETH